MEGLYLTKLDIVSVRHLRGIEIPLSETERKHLILTGKNGSGKTSVLESLRDSLEYIVSNRYVDFDTAKKNYEHFDSLIKQEVESEEQKLFPCAFLLLIYGKSIKRVNLFWPTMAMREGCLQNNIRILKKWIFSHIIQFSKILEPNWLNIWWI